MITGADPAFCSGDDVKQIMGGGEKPPDLGSREPRLTPAADALLHTDIPVIAAVNGAAVGWGMELAMYADIRVASERAKFGELFVLRGLVTDVGGLGRLSALVGRERAAELVFTGEVIDAAEAKAIGLVGRVVEHDELMPTAMAVAERIAANPPLAVQAIKRGHAAGASTPTGTNSGATSAPPSANCSRPPTIARASAASSKSAPRTSPASNPAAGSNPESDAPDHSFASGFP